METSEVRLLLFVCNPAKLKILFLLFSLLRPECIFVYVLLFIVEVLVDVARVFLSLPLHHLVRLARWKVAAQDFPHSGPEGGRNSGPGEFLQVLQVDRRVPGEKSVRWETLFTATFLAMFTITALQLYAG